MKHIIEEFELHGLSEEGMSYSEYMKKEEDYIHSDECQEIITFIEEQGGKNLICEIKDREEDPLKKNLIIRYDY